MKLISSWGRLTSLPHNQFILNSPENVIDIISQNKPGLAYGNGRSYGDVCLNAKGNLWLTNRLNHFIEFSEKTGVITCEAGVLLKEIQELTVPRGWMLPVTPGTQLVTIGGAIANDIHGKNHHVYGSFGDHILEIKLARTNGEIIECTPKKNKGLFYASIGGIGLTGIILQASIKLRRVSGPWLDTESIPFYSLSEFFKLADQSESEWEYTVSWIDCLSKKGLKGIFLRANHNHIQNQEQPYKKSKELKLTFVPPISLINQFSLKPFNKIYFELNQWNSDKKITYFETFFYPLDNILEWNKIYGPKGFFQYQCLIPVESRYDAINSILNEISKSNEGSFLSILKTFGNKSSLGMLGFAGPGVTLALDFPNHNKRTLKLLERLDCIVEEAKGKIYLAKDARMSQKFFKASYPQLNKFLKYKDPSITSSLSKRLIGI
jgi:FAD/FMN-containing dehydrogenase